MKLPTFEALAPSALMASMALSVCAIASVLGIVGMLFAAYTRTSDLGDRQGTIRDYLCSRECEHDGRLLLKCEGRLPPRCGDPVKRAFGQFGE